MSHFNVGEEMFITAADYCARVLLSLMDLDHQLSDQTSWATVLFHLGVNGPSSACLFLFFFCFGSTGKRHGCTAFGRQGLFWICGLDDSLVSTLLVDPIGGREDGRSSSLYILQSADIGRSCRLGFYVAIAIAKTDSE